MKKYRIKQYPKFKEIDYYYDSKNNSFSSQGKLLRLRKIGKDAILTFKGPVIPSRFKKREEMNMELPGFGGRNFKKISNLLNEIGYLKFFNKEKIRQKFKYKNILAFLDKLPFLGYYLEIEGGNKDIVNFVKLLGLDIEKAKKETYSQLFKLFCIFNHNKIKKFHKELEFSFKSEKEFNKFLSKCKNKKSNG